MYSRYVKMQKWLVTLSCGGFTLGILQGFEIVNFASIITQFLTTLLSLIVSILFGADPSQLFGTAATG